MNAWPLDIEGPRFFDQGDTDSDVFWNPLYIHIWSYLYPGFLHQICISDYLGSLKQNVLFLTYHRPKIPDLAVVWVCLLVDFLSLECGAHWYGVWKCKHVKGCRIAWGAGCMSTWQCWTFDGRMWQRGSVAYCFVVKWTFERLVKYLMACNDFRSGHLFFHRPILGRAEYSLMQLFVNQ